MKYYTQWCEVKQYDTYNLKVISSKYILFSGAPKTEPTMFVKCFKTNLATYNIILCCYVYTGKICNDV